MKPRLLISVVAAVLAFGANAADAVPYYDTNSHYAVGTTVLGTFDITTPGGYDPTSQIVYWASATFTFIGPDDVQSSVSINLLDGAVSQNFYVGFSISGQITTEALGILSATGQADYSITSTQGLFHILYATLTANAGPRTSTSSTAVPDGGATLGLLGLSLFGLGIFYRRTKSVRNDDI